MRVFVIIVTLLAGQALGGIWMSPDFGGSEPEFPPGSLYFQTNQYPTSPVLYRTIIEVPDRPVEWGVLRVTARQYVYVFLNGKQVAGTPQPQGRGRGQQQDAPATRVLDVNLAPYLRPGRNVLIISTRPDGMSMDGWVGYPGQNSRIEAGLDRWKAGKLAPLAILEDHPSMKGNFDDSKWFGLKKGEGPTTEMNEAEARELGRKMTMDLLAGRDAVARWRLKMLKEKGIAIADDQAWTWAGPERLSPLIEQKLGEDRSVAPGGLHAKAEALSRYVILSDDATALVGHARGMGELTTDEKARDRVMADSMRLSRVVASMQESITAGQYVKAMGEARVGQEITGSAFRSNRLTRLNRAMENKFAHVNTAALLDSDPKGWGLNIATPVSLLLSPLSPAAMITLGEPELRIEGFEKLQPIKVYNKPANVGPVGLWAVIDGKVTSLKAAADGVVYDREKNGKLSENWMLLVSDMARGGQLPIQFVFLHAPTKVTFKSNGGFVSTVSISFEQEGVKLLMLKPFKEWRGFLQTARTLAQQPLNEREAGRFIDTCRMFSRSLLQYPITYTETYAADPDDSSGVRVADVYNYIELQDEWGTKPLKTAPLPPLACYGLVTNYPGLKVISRTEVLSSWGSWGDHIAAIDTDTIIYRIPKEPIKRFGGFTSYAFSPVDIGQPGSLTEILTIKATGSNSFRPQHNQTGEPAMKTARWCVENGIQNVFNIDEKWIPDAVEHYRRLAQQCKDFPPDLIAYDLLNEPETRDPKAYGVFLKKITNAIRELDKNHLIYFEVMPAWGPGAKPFPQGAFETAIPTGDPLTVYSFHDYDYRLPERWPNEENDVRILQGRWLPALRFSIDNRAPIHLGEFGGFEQTKQSVFDNACAYTMAMDYLDTFDQFGWHFHYYANRGITRVRQDGSLQESHVQRAYRDYFGRGTFNVHHRG